jgi:hypothetical protein
MSRHAHRHDNFSLPEQTLTNFGGQRSDESAFSNRVEARARMAVNAVDSPTGFHRD